MNKVERLAVNFELRAATECGAPKIIGHAAVFNSPTTIRTQSGAFQESVAPGAFRQAIQEDDVRALFNHNPNYVLGRSTAGTLRMSEDERGLAVEIDPPDAQWANDLMVSMRRGDINQMSFGFIAREQSWEKRDGGMHRTIKRASLQDVSPVTYGAYPSTDVSVRSAQEIYEEFEAERRAAETAVPVDISSSEPIPAQPEPEPADYEGILEIQRKRLQLIG